MHALGVLLVTLLVVGCTQRSPTVPSQDSAPPAGEPPVVAPVQPTTSIVLTGIVSGDGQPLANVNVEVEEVLPNGCCSRQFLKTDASGRYRVDMPNRSLSILVTAYHHDRYQFQPCAAGFEQSELGPPERTVDVSLFSAEGLSRAVTLRVAGRRNVTGTIHTLTTTGKQPKSDASVAWDLWNDVHVAWTQTNAAGRFTLCGLPMNRRVQLYAQSGRYEEFRWGWVTVEPGGDSDVEMILERPR
jgi:hypothetical protein